MSTNPTLFRRQLETMRRVYRREDDGITHLNVRFNSRHRLAHLLSMQTNLSFTVGKDGTFQSLAGYCYWLRLGSNPQYDYLKDIHGYDIANVRLQPVLSTQQVMDKLSLAQDVKISQNLELHYLLLNNELELTNYIYKDNVYLRMSDYDWLLDAADFYSWSTKQRQYSTIVAGSRSVSSLETVEQALLESRMYPTTIVSGAARGADKLGEQLADKYDIKKTIVAADWDTYGKQAGMIRNTQMAKQADSLIAIWDGRSKGTKHMIDTMSKLSKPVYVKIVDPIPL